MRLGPASLPILFPLIFTACGQEREPIDPPDPNPNPSTPTQFSVRGLDANATSVRGLAIDPSSKHLQVLLPGIGVVESTIRGKKINEVRFNEHGLTDFAPSDLAIRADGRWVLASYFDTMLYDRQAETTTSYFCLEPGWTERIEMKNEAVAIDTNTGEIYAAPAYFNLDGDPLRPFRSLQAIYASANGEVVDTFDVLNTNIVAQGFAYDGVADRLYAVEASKLTVFRRGGTVERQINLDGIQNASAIALDPERNTVWIADDATLKVTPIALDRIR